MFFQKLLLIQLIISIFSVVNADLNNDCYINNSLFGKCTYLQKCNYFYNMLLNPASYQLNKQQAIQTLKNYGCGFIENNPLVCCPIQSGNPSRYSLNRPIISQDFSTSQTNRNPFLKQSVSLKDSVTEIIPTKAPNPFYTTIDSMKDPEVRKYLTTTESPRSTSNLLPKDCGRVLTFKYFVGYNVEFDDFPWTALLEYDTPLGQEIFCGGALISKRYVLTAASCVVDISQFWTLKSVRLGEYDINSQVDCLFENSSENITFCADAAVSYPIEDKIVYPVSMYIGKSRMHDIALLRLGRDVTFTNFIKPICLPTKPTVYKRLYTSGWSRSSTTSGLSVKKMSYVTLQEKQYCRAKYNLLDVSLSSEQICAGASPSERSCIGDIGGPLMGVAEMPDQTNRVTIFGVLARTYSPWLTCKSDSWPGVYTDVLRYVPWIVSQIEP